MQLIPHIILMLEGFSTFLDETCDADCDNVSPVGQWTVEEIKCNATKEGCFPNIEQLRRLCPQTLRFLNCKSKAMDDCEEELKSDPNTNPSILTKYSMNTENIIRDVCDENSPFRKDYASKINCYKGMYFMLNDVCFKMFNQTQREFIEYLGLTNKEIPNEVKCLLIAYQDACLAQRFRTFCGMAAQRIFFKTQQVFQGIFSFDCSQVGEEWKAKFSTFLQQMWKESFRETFMINWKPEILM